MGYEPSDPSDHQPSGTGEARSAGDTAQGPASDDADPLRPPDPAETLRQVNRSGSGGTGGDPTTGDASEEGSGSRSLDEMLGGDPGEG